MVSEIRVPSSSNSKFCQSVALQVYVGWCAHTDGDWLDLHTLLDVGGGRVI